MKITVESNAVELSNWMRVAFADQMDFALSMAINTTAFDVRDAQRAGVEQRFTIRREWVLRGIQQSKRATKGSPEAVVLVTSDREFLTRFEEGKKHWPKGRHFAVPEEARRTKSDIVQKSERPRSFRFKFHGRRPKAEVFQGERRTFLINWHNDDAAIFRRTGRGGRYGQSKRKTRARDTTVRLLYWLPERAELPDSLQFHSTAERTFDETFTQNFEAAFDRAVRTAR